MIIIYIIYVTKKGYKSKSSIDLFKSMHIWRDEMWYSSSKSVSAFPFKSC